MNESAKKNVRHIHINLSVSSFIYQQYEINNILFVNY